MSGPTAGDTAGSDSREGRGAAPPAETEQIALGMNEASFKALEAMVPRHERMFSVPSFLDETQLVLQHPDEIRHVLLGNHPNYRKGRTFRNMKLLMGNGLIVQEGEFWRQQRRMMQPLFHARVLAEMSRTMRNNALRTAERWAAAARAGEAVNVTDDISRATLQILLETLFGEDLESMKDAQGRNPFELLTDDSSRTFSFVPRYRAILQHVFVLLERRTAEGRYPPDLLSMLMMARTGGGAPMTAAQLVDEVSTLIVAGHETTATVLHWAWHLLSRHPGEERRFHEEIDPLSDDDGGDGLLELPNLKRVLFETMRLYPPVWIEDRQAIEDDVIEGFRVPAGAELFIPIYFIHRSPRHFEDASSFQPERFLSFQMDRRYRERRDPAAAAARPADARANPDRRSEHVKDYYTFIPFGAGPRRCIGDQLALLNAQIHMSVIGRRVRFDASVEDLGLEPRVNLRPRHDFVAIPRLR